MSETEQDFSSWKEVITDFIVQRENLKIHDLLAKKVAKKADNDVKQAIIIQLFYALENDPSVDNDQIEEIKNKKNAGKDKVDKFDFQMNKYDALIKLSNNSIEAVKVNDLYLEKESGIKKFHELTNWITYYSERAGGVHFATHVAKISHSSIKNVPSFYVLPDDNTNTRYATTESIRQPIIDDAIDNAALTPIANFLKLTYNGKDLAGFISKGISEPFEEIVDISIAEQWVKSLSKVFILKELKSHSLLKQTFFPLKNDTTQYHLLSIVKSSSMAHYLYERSKYKKVDKSKYNKESINTLLNTATLSLTASSKAHTNVSPLHAKRSGTIQLFSTQPPIWEKQLKPPIYTNSFFYKVPLYAIKDDLEYLSKFLSRFKSLELSINDPKRREHLERWVNSIIDSVFFYVASIQNLPAGWSDSESIKLNKAHQFLLDPFRTDEVFKAQRESDDWQNQLCSDFSNWLNHLLKKEDKTFTPQMEHRKKWTSLFKTPLREDTESIKILLKETTKSEVEV